MAVNPGVLDREGTVVRLSTRWGQSWHRRDVADSRFVGQVAEQCAADSSDMFDTHSRRLAPSLDADGRRETFSMPYRYVWPSELDLMARLAGQT